MCALAAFLLTGCSSSNDPVNLDKDKPVHLKKEKEKDK
jgi:hypothetical protein